MVRYATIILITCVVCLCSHNAWSKVFQNQGKTYTTEASPVDIAGSADGKYTFVLLEGGKVMVYAASGETDQVQVDPDFDKIYASATGDAIFLSSHKNKTIQEIKLDFLRVINTDGAPHLGRENAPIVLTVFSDFQ